MKWIPVEERTPENDATVLLSFANLDTTYLGRYVEDEDCGGKFMLWSDGWRVCMLMDLYVNAWMPMPKPYREDEE